ETGDATTYTGFYTASLAWKFAVTKKHRDLERMEKAIQTLHRTIKGTANHPILTRFVDADNTPDSVSPSKDVYTSFFFAYATAFPYVKDPELKRQMVRDIDHLSNRFLKDELTIREGTQTLMNLKPTFS